MICTNGYDISVATVSVEDSSASSIVISSGGSNEIAAMNVETIDPASKRLRDFYLSIARKAISANQHNSRISIKLGSLHGEGDIAGVVSCILAVAEKSPKLKVAQKCRCMEFACSGRALVADPTDEEARAAEGHFAVLVWDDSSVQVQKEAGGVVPYEAIVQAIKCVRTVAEPMAK